MVKYIDILKAIQDKLTTKFPTIKIVSESDVEEKIIRPSFMVMLDGIKAEDFMSSSIDKTMTARIFYFSTVAEKNKLENLKMIDSLEELFLENNNLELNDFNIPIGEYSIEIPDKVLEYSFELNFNQSYERDYSDIENMEDIELNIIKED